MSAQTEQRIAGLRHMGYTEREAGFLLLAALHSGAFVARQYAGFINAKPGYATDQLVSKATSQQHVRTYPSKNRSIIYQICEPIFDAVGDVDNRNFQLKQPDLTRLRLMSLDFVLAHQDRTYHPTEAEKLALFSALAVDSALLPSQTYQSSLGEPRTTRYFTERTPIYTHVEGVGFAFLCSSSIQTFETFLDKYLPLMLALPESELVYVSTKPAMIALAQRAFQKKTEGYNPVDSVNLEMEFRERLELEKQYVEVGFAGISMESLHKIRRHRGSPNSKFYETWKEKGLAGLPNSIKVSAAAEGSPVLEFTSYLLPDAYQLL